MENVSQIQSTIREKSTPSDILVVSRSFLPKEGGIGEYVYNRCIQDPERVIVLAASCSGDKAFDAACDFPVYRWQIPRCWLRGFLGRILKQFWYMTSSFVLAIKLYFRYHYRYIEWSHGYDFLSILLLSYILPINFFIYIHGNDIVYPLSNPLLHFLFQWTLTRASGIVCNSSRTKDLLKANFIIDTPTYVIHPQVRPEKFDGLGNSRRVEDLRNIVRTGYNIPETATVILSVGKLVRQNGFDRVIENLTILLTHGVDVHYIICGRGPHEAELKSLAHHLRLDGRVHFVGAVSNKELASYYSACDIFTILNLLEGKKSTKKFNVSGLGTAYLEASYFGKPIIASKDADVIDAVNHEENGILVNPHSGNEVFQAFRKLCQDKNLREKFGRRGKELAKRKTPHRLLYQQ